MKEKKVVVFGGSGFLGSHVADALSEQQFTVTVYDSKPSPYISEHQKMVVGDIMDESLVWDTVKDAQYVYNFAGITDLEEARQKPQETIRFNILGNSIILEACRRAGVKRFVFASSIYIYGKSGSFYRSSKQACELFIDNYNEIFGLPYTILRYGSLYGPRADDHNFIHRIIKQALSEKKIVRNGDGEEIREYNHVQDAARSSVEILSEEFANQCVIITGDQQMKVKDLLAMIKEILENKIKIEYKPATKSYHYEITPYTFSPKLAKRLINRTYIDLGQGILRCIQSTYDQNQSLNSAESLISTDKNRISDSVSKDKDCINK